MGNAIYRQVGTYRQVDTFIPIATAADLDAIRSTDSHIFAVGTEWEKPTAGGLNKVYTQVADIDLTAWGNWTAIVNFTGTYDGQGHTIDNMYVDNSASAKYSGLFGSCGAGAVIKRLGVINAYVKNGYTASSATDYKGIICGMFYGSFIENCYVTGEVVVGTDRAGGLVGYVSGAQIRYCYAAVYLNGVNSNIRVGGFSGWREGAGTNHVNCYWDTTVATTTNNGTSSEGTNPMLKTTAQMQLQATFVNWDFISNWNISTGYPFLQLIILMSRVRVRNLHHKDGASVVRDKAAFWLEKGVSGYQQWAGYPDSLDKTATYPYQTIIFISSIVQLIMSETPFYMTGPYFISNGSLFHGRYYNNQNPNDWDTTLTAFSGRGTGTLYESNCNVFADDTLTSIYFSKTTATSQDAGISETLHRINI